MTTTTPATDRPRRGLSARTRILGWMMILVAVAIAAVVVITARVLHARLDADARSELTHEARKFHTFAHRHGAASSVEDLLTSYLAQNLPNNEETFFSIVDGRPAQRSAARPPARLDLDRPFVARAAAADEPMWGTVDTDAGRAYYAVLPVHSENRGERGALVSVEFVHDAQAEVTATIRILAFVGVGAWLLAGAVGWFIAGQVLDPIRTVRRTAEAIGASDLSRRIEVTGTGDIAELAETFNRMLDRVEHAFASQRDFLDDAAHELRTPITIVRGHTEVVGDDPIERERTQSLVVAELDRMARLVDDLLVLAKAERPDFLVPGPVDVAELIVETLAKVQPLASRHWEVAEVAERVAWADEQRLTQALTQLVANAIDHTDASDTIALGSRVTGDRLALWVTDTGSGIDLEAQQHVFDRFRRGDADARLGRGGGAGLGLAIVASIARAHGGRVDLVSAPGEGATFTLDVPFVPAEETTANRSSP